MDGFPENSRSLEPNLKPRPDLPSTGTQIHDTRYGRLIENGPAHLMADHATRFVLDHVTVHHGDLVAEPGCGTGVISLFAALAGASRVIGTDIDPIAVSTAHRNACLNNLPTVNVIRASLLLPLAPLLDLVVALLPHKPAPMPFNHRYYGGIDGTDLLLAVIDQSAERLRRGGRLVLYVNSIANPDRVLRAFTTHFDVRLLSEKRRDFTREEFDGLTPGMFRHLEMQKAQGQADFRRDDMGLFFLARLYEGTKR